MLSYKEYKLLNESLYGAFNLGIRNPATVGGIISGSNVNGTEAALEAESEEALEESKKKKKMDCGDEEPEDEEKDMEDEKEEEGEEEESEDEEDEEEDSEDEEEEPKFMKKKAKKEWSEVMSDLEDVLEGVSDDSAKDEIRKGLELIKEGIKKGKNKGHKKGCDCNFCKNVKANKEEKDEEGLTDAQKKLPKGLRDVIAKKGEDKDDKKCGSYMKKGCGAKYMKEEDQAWWSSVNSMINADPNQKSWDGWSEVGEVEQAIREGSELKKKADESSSMNEVNSDAAQKVADRWADIATKTGDPRHQERADRASELASRRGPQGRGLELVVYYYHQGGSSREMIVVNDLKVENKGLLFKKPSSVEMRCTNQDGTAFDLFLDLNRKTLIGSGIDGEGGKQAEMYLTREGAAKLSEFINQREGKEVVNPEMIPVAGSDLLRNAAGRVSRKSYERLMSAFSRPRQ